MNRLEMIVASVALCCTAMVAQQNSRSGAVRTENAESTITSRKAVALSGRVSDDGKLLISEDQDRWAVSNPSSLSAHAGRLVTVKCQLSPDQNSIHVLAVKPVDSKYAAVNDAAFRR